MKKILFTIVALATIVGCQREELFVEPEEKQVLSGPEFTAQIETFGSETKTALSVNSVVWSSGDQLAIFQGKDIADRYQVKDNSAGSSSGIFNFVENGKGTPSVEYDANIAVYPYEEDLRCIPNVVDGEVASYTITGVTIPQKQTHIPGSFPDESLLMAAITKGSQDYSLRFKNLCGILHLQMTGTAKITSIVITGRNNEILSGDATITIPDEGVPSLVMCAETNNGLGTYVYRTIMLDCGEGVQLDLNNPTSFFITVPPGVFTKGFVVSFTDYEGKTQRMEVVNTKNTIGRSYIHSMPEQSVETVSSTSMICEIKGNNIYVRSRSFDGQNDLFWILAKEHSGNNKFFNISQIWICPTNNANDRSDTGRLYWKSASDDICPIQVWGHHVGGNHGYDCVDKVKVTDHGKSYVDIGSVWTDNNGYTYVLMFVYDKDYLGFVRFNDEMMEKGNMECALPKKNTVMTFVSGAENSNKNDIKLNANSTKAQLWRCSNNHQIKLYVDGVERSLNDNGVILGDRVEILAEYDVIFIPAMLKHLMANAGNNTDDSQHDESISEYYYRLSTRYQFNRNGSVSQYNTYTIGKTFEVGYGGLVQSYKLPENDPEIKTATYKISYIGDPYIYTPDLKDYSLIWHNTEETDYKMYKDTWEKSDKVPYRYYQFTTEKAEKGMCLAYDRSTDWSDKNWGANHNRLQHIGEWGYAGRYKEDSKKMYPAFFSVDTFEAGLTFDGLGCRIPLYKLDPDVTSVAWYWVESGEMDYDASDDDIVLMIDSHKAVDKEIFLPAYMNNMKIKEVLDSKNVVCEQTQLDGRKLRYNTGGADYGYLVVRLSK